MNFSDLTGSCPREGLRGLHAIFRATKNAEWPIGFGIEPGCYGSFAERMFEQARFFADKSVLSDNRARIDFDSVKRPYFSRQAAAKVKCLVFCSMRRSG